MPQILQNLAEMTGHRDHLRLEASVLTTLQTLGNITNVRALELFTYEGKAQLRPRTWIDEGRLTSSDVEACSDARRESLDNYPALCECIAHHQKIAQASLCDGSYVIWLPVWMHDQVTTCLEITKTQTFSERSLDVIKGVFQVYQNYQSLLDYSERDALTGLLNRKTFDDQFSRQSSERLRSVPELFHGSPDLRHIDGEAASAEPQQQWLAVIDIDHFKMVNDRFGHLYGDEVLILVANILRSSYRSNDRIFRFGGEEFVVLLRSTTLSMARTVFDRFRQTVQEYPFPQVGQITVSVGFVGTDQGLPVEILGKADQALYYAKEHGRNQVCSYDDLVAQGQLAIQIVNDDVELF